MTASFRLVKVTCEGITPFYEIEYNVSPSQEDWKWKYYNKYHNLNVAMSDLDKLKQPLPKIKREIIA